MKHFTGLLFAFLLFSNSSFAQCDFNFEVTDSYSCTPSSIARIAITSDVPSNWEVSPQTGVSISYEANSNDKKFSATFQNPNDYRITITDKVSGCSVDTIFTVYQSKELITNVKSNYELCDDEVDVDFVLGSLSNFKDYDWFFEGEILTGNPQIKFTEPGQKSITILATDINDCEMDETFNFNVNEGPVFEEILTKRIDVPDGCVEAGLDYSLELSHTSNYSNSFVSPPSILINTSSEANDLIETFNEPITLSFENSECVIDTVLNYSHDISHEVRYESIFDGVLCSEETITLFNTSPHKAIDNNNFSWSAVSGEIISSDSNSITFVPPSDGDYNWALDYNGTCTSSYSVTTEVDLDFIEPVLSDNINQSTCDFNLPVNLSHETTLDISNNDYSYSWLIKPSQPAFDNSSVLSSPNSSVSLELISSKSQSYDLNFSIENRTTGCSGSKEFKNYFSIGGVAAELNSEPLLFCELGTFNTSDLTPSSQINDFDYNWSISRNNREIATGDSYSSFIDINQYGAYDVELNIKSSDGCESTVSEEDIVVFNDYTTSIDPIGSICFNGAASTTEEFRVSVAPQFNGYDFTVSTESWNLRLPDGTETSLNSTGASALGIHSGAVASTTSYDFVKSGVYTLTYSISIDGTNEACEYQVSETFNLGVEAEILEPSVICVGKDFEVSINKDNASNSYQYEWTVSSGLNLDDSNSSAPKIIANTLPNPTSQQIGLKLTNAEGCWVEASETIEVYEVVADFSVSNPVLHCPGQDVEISSLNNNRITDWIWTIEETSSTTNKTEFDPNYTHTFTDVGQSNVTLKLISQEGCEGTKIIENAVSTYTFTTNLEPVPDNICFGGAQSITQEFIANTVIDLDIYSFNALVDTWELVLPDGSIDTPVTIAQTFTPFIKSTSSYNFTVTGEYTIRYTINYKQDNEVCEYQASETFNVGVEAEILEPSVICVGKDFEVSFDKDNTSNSYQYEWTVSSGLNIDNTSSATPEISASSQPSEANQELKLKLTNAEGCWVEASKTIEVYEVVADFSVSNPVLHCSDQEATLTSNNNDRISNWLWTIEEPGAAAAVAEVNDDASYTHSFTQVGQSDLSLTITSQEGCQDTQELKNEVLLNDYTTSIDPIGSICFNGAASTTEEFRVSVAPQFNGYDFTVFTESWNLRLPDGTETSLNSTGASALGIHSGAVASTTSYDFVKSGVYTLTYSISIDGTNEVCEYQVSETFNVGVEAEILEPSVICVGKDFEVSINKDNTSNSYQYEWTVFSGLNIDNPGSATPEISASSQPSEANQELKLKLTNEEGCYVEASKTIEVYEVVADFSVSDSVLHCAPQEISFNSLNNTYIQSWDWEVFIHEDDDKNVYSNSSQPSPFFMLNNAAIYDGFLRIVSTHGCSESLYRDSIVLIDTLELTINDLDGQVCFDGKPSIEKTFEIGMESLFNTDLNVSDYAWKIEPDAAMITSESQSEIMIKFVKSDVYTLSYDLSINNAGNTCTYSKEIELEIGVNADLTIPDALCVGGESEILSNVSVGVGDESYYNWSSDSGLIIVNQNELSTSIVAIDSLTPGIIMPYHLGFTITNNNGCLEQIDTLINVYQVDADFETSPVGEVCAFEKVNFESTYSEFISSYKWSSSGIDYKGAPTPDLLAGKDTSEVNFSYTEMGIYDVSLELISRHGCEDKVTKKDLYDVKRPYPKFTFKEDYGCDGTTIEIIDQSELSSKINFEYDYFDEELDSLYGLYIDSTVYALNEVNEIDFFFPYTKTDELSYRYPVELSAFLGRCSASFLDTITIYPNPIIDVKVSDSIGCPPFEVDFKNNSSFFDKGLSTYQWDFGNNTVDENFENNNLYTTVGEYDVYHSIISENGCFSEKILPEKIKVFSNPMASFEYETYALCYNAPFVDFFDNSIFETDSIFTEWVFDFDTLSVSYKDSLRLEFESASAYDVGLIVTDLRGCSDDTLQTINIEILDNKITRPEIEYVTVNSSGVEIYWKENSIDSNFETMEIYHRSSSDEWSNIDSVKNITNNYFHNSVEQYTVNDYCLLQYDSCGIISDTSLVHSTIFLETQSTDYQTMDLSWAPYVGWEEVLRYEIFRSDDELKYKLVDTVAGDVSFYTDTNLCNTSYTHYVVARHPNGVFKSNSNISISKEPLFIDFTQPLELVRTTVVNDQYLTTEWDEFYTHEMTYYNIHRWDEYFGWISDYSAARDSLFVDPSANPKGRKYKYRASYADECGNEGPNSGVGANILLKGEQFPEHYYLRWNAYEDWAEGVGNYTLQYYNSDDSSYVNLKTLSNSSFEYTDQDLVKNGIDTSYCYRVVARSMSNNYSISNDFCFVPSPKKYFPNAFTPDGDGVNDHYSYSGLFGKAIEVNIYDRWGSLVFTSNDIDFVWDGTYNNSGKYCPMGTYIMEFELVGFDGTVIRDQTSIVLYR